MKNLQDTSYLKLFLSNTVLRFLYNNKKRKDKMNFELLFDIKLNDDIDKNWLKFKNETTLLYTYY